MVSELTKLSQSMADAVDKAGAATVLVNGRRRIPATGVAISKDLILTASHVIERDEDLSVILPDGSEVKAELKGRDPNSDLALLKLAKAQATPAKLNGEPRVGQMVLALGRPSTEGIQASLGVVSAIGGATHTRRGGMLEGYIRTDAIPYPGFSGGPLIDGEGQVIGINTSGLGPYTIPIEVATKIADSLEKHGTIKRGYLGIRSQIVDLPEDAKLEQKTGLLVVSLEEDSPATGSGLMVGDIIVGLNKQTVESHDELLALLTGEIVGKASDLEVLRGGKPKTLKVNVAERKQSTGRKRGRMRMGWYGPHFGFPGPHHRRRRR